MIQTSERIEEATEKREWRTIIKVAKVRSEQVFFDVDGNLIEEWDKNTKKGEDQGKGGRGEEGHKRRRDDNKCLGSSDFSSSNSASLPALISASNSAT